MAQEETSVVTASGAAAASVAPGDPVEMTATADNVDSVTFEAVDADGNAVSFTTSVERAFGSRLMVRGFLLNNQLTDFSFRAEANGEPVSNRVEPGKRPRSSMSPTIEISNRGR